jgi:hypothetical protein
MDGDRVAEDETANLCLSRHEVRLLEVQLSRDVAHLQDELEEGGEGSALLAQQIEELRHLEERLRHLLREFETLPDVV